MIYPLVRELAATGAPIRVPVAVTCRVLKIAKQPFYRWLKAPVSTRDWDDAQLTNAAIDAHEEAPTFGYRLIADELTDLGFEVSERRVWRLCSQQGIVSATTRKKRGKAGKQGPPVHDDLVQRQFTAAGPNQLWLTDITEHWTGEGKLYLCAIKDVFSNRIVGYSIDDRMTADLAVNALRMAIQRRRPVGTTVHSDRGSQGGFNWLSQHLEYGGAGWYDDSRTRIGRSVRSSGLRDIRNISDPSRLDSGRLSRRGSSLRKLLNGSGLRLRLRRDGSGMLGVCHHSI